LIVGNKRAVMFDAGSRERPTGSKSMRQLAAFHTATSITLVLSHFHYDHIYDASSFEDAVTLIDRPEIRAGVKKGLYAISALESFDAEALPLKVAGFIADGDMIDLGNRTLGAMNLPGHTTESIVLIDKARNQTFTGDFVYRHLGGIIAFAPASNLPPYKANSDRLLEWMLAVVPVFGALALYLLYRVARLFFVTA
jgi:glyoxylase-like metal-dependent hydrolase (beta-lactamase superfamily II)